MLCKSYSELSHLEKVRFIGEVVHSIQSDERMYSMGKIIIEVAKTYGIFDGVEVGGETKFSVSGEMEEKMRVLV